MENMVSEMENMVSDSIEGQFKIKVEPVTRDDLIRSYWIDFLTKFYQIFSRFLSDY